MTRRFRFAVAFLGASVICQPGFAAENWPDSVDQYVAQVRKTIDTTEMEGYLAVVKNPNGALVLDVREETEFKAGHVPGTVNVSRGRLEFRIWKPVGYPGKVGRYEPQDICAMRDRRPRYAGGQATQGYRLHQRYGSS